MRRAKDLKAKASLWAIAFGAGKKLLTQKQSFKHEFAHFLPQN
jgi:hypothetical protein